MGGKYYSDTEVYYLTNLINDNVHVSHTELAQMAHDYGMLKGRTVDALMSKIRLLRETSSEPKKEDSLRIEIKDLKKQNAELQQDLDTLRDAIINGMHLRSDKNGNTFVAFTFGLIRKGVNEVFHVEYNTKIGELYQEEGTNAYQYELIPPEGD